MESRSDRPATTTVRMSYDGLAGAAPAVRALLARADVVLALGPPGRPDLAVVDAVARLALAARRSGTGLLVRAPDLADLAGLCGLGRVLGSGQPGGQPQPGEQLGPEEVVDVDDPPA